MIRPSALAIAAALALSGGLSACANMPMTEVAGPQIPTQVQYVADAHSHARPEIARVHHVDLNLTADFDRRMLAGTASLDITAEPGADEIILDIRDLDIHGVRSDDGPLDYTIGDESPFMGKPLTIAIPFTEGRIHIDYSTRPDAAALQWLTPEQTAGGQLPYLFSQGQAILTRTWIPTQDSPGIRQTYSARITVPADMKAVMSAEMLTPEGEMTPDGRRAFRFRLDQSRAALSDRHRRWRHRLPAAGRAHRSLYRAVHAGTLRRRVPRGRGHGRGGRGALRPLHLGPL